MVIFGTEKSFSLIYNYFGVICQSINVSEVPPNLFEKDHEHNRINSNFLNGEGKMFIAQNS